MQYNSMKYSAIHLQVCEDQQPKKEEPKTTEPADDPVKKQLGEMIQGLPLTLLQQSVRFFTGS